MLADGEMVECSRDKESELFGLAMGGYGLFGVILDLDVEMTPNVLLQAGLAADAGGAFRRAFPRGDRKRSRVADGLWAAFGRPRDFLSEALLTTYRAAPTAGAVAGGGHVGGSMNWISSDLYRKQTGSEAASACAGPRKPGGPQGRLGSGDTQHADERAGRQSRQPFSAAHRHPARIFRLAARFKEFLAACREVIPPAKAEFLNVTLRYVAADPTAVMAHSRTRIAAVMSFRRKCRPKAKSTCWS